MIKIKLMLFGLFCVFQLFSQEKLDSVSFSLIKSNKRYVKVHISNNKSTSIYFMNNKYAGQRAYKFITNCDSLNSSSYSKPINLPPNFYSKKRMIQVKDGKSRKIKFKLSSKYFGLNKCKSEEKAYLYLKIFVYQFDKQEKVEVKGFIISSKKIDIN